MMKVGGYTIDPNKISVISPKVDLQPHHNAGNGNINHGQVIRHFWIVCDGHRIDFGDANHWQVDQAFDQVMMCKGLSQ
jgi:hypothetical protein